MVIRRIALLGFFLIAACGSVGVGNQAHAITLAYKAGDTYKYQFHAALDYTVGIQSMTIPVKVDLSANEKLTVKSVDSSGTADLTADLSNMKITTTLVEPISSRRLVQLTFFISLSVAMRKSTFVGLFISRQAMMV